MEKAKTFRDLIVWRKAHEFVLLVYKVTSHFPKEETYGLTIQFRKAAVSVPGNIAEGFRKKSNKDKLRFYNIAQGYLEESSYYIILSKDLNYISSDEWKDLNDKSEEVSRLLNSLFRSIPE